ncbi:hypothetical protein Gotur_017199 [Gossypium turneri]
MEKEQSAGGDISSAQAVLLGALAPGVNVGLCLALMLGLAFSSTDSSLILHVAFLVLIAITLFLLLNWFLEQTGLVSVERQMQEMDLIPNNRKRE